MKNILVLTYWSFREGLIQSYTLPYLFIISKYLKGGKIYLVTLEKEDIALSPNEMSDAKTNLEKYNIQLIALKYRSLSLGVIFIWINEIFNLSRFIRKNKINTIHAWCTPAGLIGYILSIMNKIPLILDSFEPHAEAMVENGSWRKTSFSFRFLFFFEKIQAQRAIHVIAANKGMFEYSFKKYGVKLKSFHVKPACVDIEKFGDKNVRYLKSRLGLNGKVTCVYAGKIGGIYLDEELFTFFKRASIFWKDNFKVLLLTNEKDTVVNRWVDKVGLNPKIILKQFVHFDQIHEYFALADFGITLVKPLPSKKYCTPIKDGEYWATGLPVVITKDISNDSEIIRKNNIGYVLNSLNEYEFDRAIVKIDQLIKDKSVTTKIRDIAKRERGFHIAKKIYKEIYQ